jgi:hypothetical protein
MSTTTPVETTNLDQYGDKALPWQQALDAMRSQVGSVEVPFFLSTVDQQGVPHTAGIGALWVEDKLWVVSGPDTRKSRNLAKNPNCTVAVHLQGIDLVFEGQAERVTDGATVKKLAAAYRENGWPAEVDASGNALTAPFTAPSGGPPPWYLYHVTFHTVFGVGGEPGGATRWRFA